MIGLLKNTVILVWGLFFVILINSNIEAERPVTTGFLRVEGRKVMDEKGQGVNLRGLCLGPFHFFSFKESPDSPYSLEEINAFNRNIFSHYVTRKDIQKIKRMGANVIRQQISFYALEVEPYQYNDGVFMQIDRLIRLGYRKGIYVVPVLTDAAQNSFQQGNIRYYNGVRYLWTDEEWKKRVISALRYIAKRYANNPGIAGYDVINEPEAITKEGLHSFYSEAIREIRKEDFRHIIILERQHFTNVGEILFGGEYDDTNVMLSLHHYEDEGLQQCIANANYSSYAQLEKIIGDFLYLDEVKNRPVYVGEFGAITSNADAFRWTRDIMDIMNRYGIHYTYFNYKNIYGFFDNQKGCSRGLYQARSELFSGCYGVPIDELIDCIEDRVDQLLTANFHLISNLKRILEEKFKY